MSYYSKPDLSTLDRRVIFAARVLQEAHQRDPEFRDIYYTIAHKGHGLGSILHDLAAKIRREDGNCRLCPHHEHEGRRCNAPITETIRDDVGIFAKPTGIVRDILVGTCGCGTQIP